MARRPDVEPISVTVTHAAELLGVSTDTLYRLMHRRAIPTVTVGRRRLIPYDGLKRYIAQRQAAEEARRERLRASLNLRAIERREGA